MMSNEQLILSKQRVKDFGEVFTPTHLVKEMCDLVWRECDYDTTFFEPSCGTGNFLSEILARKLLDIAEDGEPVFEAMRKFYIALGAVYGCDIQQDNVEFCRERLRILFNSMAKGNDIPVNDELVSLILTSNIQCCDTLNDSTIFARVDVVGGKLLLDYFEMNLSNGEARPIIKVLREI